MSKNKKITKKQLIKILKTTPEPTETTRYNWNRKVSHKEWLKGYWKWRKQHENSGR